MLLVDTNADREYDFLELDISSTDWGEANLNPMVRAYGLKKDRIAKCKSCLFFKKNTCKFVCSSVEHSGEYRACKKYINKRRSVQSERK